MSDQMNRAELLKRIRGLGKISKPQRNGVVCSLIGHSRIHSNCMGYKYCGRCGEQVGDSLAGGYTGKENVIVGHNCKVCRANFKKLTWADKLYVADPFRKQP